MVSDDGVGETELANNIFPNEALDLCCCDGCERLCLSPFCEVIHYDDHKAGWPLPFKNRSNQVQPSLCKQPRASHGGESLGLLVEYVREELAWATRFGQTPSVSIHGRPKVSSSRNLSFH